MNMSQTIFSFTAGFAVIIGVLQCLFGYRIFKVVLGLTGFFAGFVLAFSILQDGGILALVAGLIGGMIGALLMSFFYRIGVFVVGAFLGSVFGIFGLAVTGAEDGLIFLIVLSLISGLISLYVQKFMIILSTSFVGSWIAVAGVAFLLMGAAHPLGLEHLFQSTGLTFYAVLVSWLTLGIAGMAYQFRSTAPEDD